MPVDRGLHTALYQPVDDVRAHDLLAKCFVLEKLEVAQCRTGVGQVFEIGRTVPVLKVGEVGDKARLAEEFLGGEVVEVEGVCEGLDELVRCQYVKL